MAIKIYQLTFQHILKKKQTEQNKTRTEKKNELQKKTI